MALADLPEGLGITGLTARRGVSASWNAKNAMAAAIASVGRADASLSVQSLYS